MRSLFGGAGKVRRIGIAIEGNAPPVRGRKKNRKNSRKNKGPSRAVRTASKKSAEKSRARLAKQGSRLMLTSLTQAPRVNSAVVDQALKTLEKKLGDSSKTVRKMFRSMDRNKDHMVDPNEFRRVLMRFNLGFPESVVGAMFARLDRGNKGFLNLDDIRSSFGNAAAPALDHDAGFYVHNREHDQRMDKAFVRRARGHTTVGAKHQNHTVDEALQILKGKIGDSSKTVRAIFLSMDKNKDASISLVEFRKMLRRFNLRFSATVVSELFSRIDIGGKGFLKLNDIRTAFGHEIAGHAGALHGEEGGFHHLNTDMARMRSAKRNRSFKAKVTRTGLRQSMSAEAAMAILKRKVGDAATSVQKIFRSMDRDKDHAISPSEFGNVLTRFNLEVSKEVEASMFSRMDKHGKGFLTMDDIRRTFGHDLAGHTIDHDESGFYKFDNTDRRRMEKARASRSKRGKDSAKRHGHASSSASEALATLKMKLADTSKTVRGIFRSMDKNKDHRISLTEFAQLMRRFNLRFNGMVVSEMFSMIDEGNKGYLSMHDIREAFGHELAGHTVDTENGFFGTNRNDHELSKIERAARNRSKRMRQQQEYANRRLLGMDPQRKSGSGTALVDVPRPRAGSTG